MRAKKKLIISMLVVSFVLLSIIATVAIAFALIQQTIKTNLNINYKAVDIDATVSASVIYADGTEESMVTPNGKATSVKFNADGTVDPNGTSLVPSSAINLTLTDSYVVLKYSFANTGPTFTADYNYVDEETLDENINVTYSKDGVNFGVEESLFSIESDQTSVFYIKLQIEDIAKNAEFSGDVTWELVTHTHRYPTNSDEAFGNLSINPGSLAYNKDVFNGDYISGQIYGQSICMECRHVDTSNNGMYLYEGRNASSTIITPELFNPEIGTWRINNILANHANGGSIYLVGEFTSTIFWTFATATTYDISNLTIYGTPNTRIKAGMTLVHPTLSISNLTLDGLIFEGKDSLLDIQTSAEDGINGVNIVNCKFITEEKSEANPAIRIMSTYNILKDITLKNCFFYGHYQGIYVSGAHNATIINNKFEKMVHNGIALQSSPAATSPTDHATSGTILIKNNEFIKGTDRAIRFGFLNEATVTIDSNRFTNTSDADGENVKSNDAFSTTWIYSNNIVNMESVPNQNGTGRILI